MIVMTKSKKNSEENIAEKSAAGRRTKRGRPTQLRVVENGYRPFTNNELVVLVPKHKLDIILHPAQYKEICGAKDSGKTWLAAICSICSMEEDVHAHILAARKYKLAAAEKFHRIFSNVIMEIRLAGFDILDLHKKDNKSIKLVNKKNAYHNQTIEYVSFEDENGISGTEPPNLGYYSNFIADEPVLKDDVGKIPTRKEWNSTLRVVTDTINRANRRHEAAFNRKVPKTTYWFLFNMWDENHPLVENVNLVIPEDDFLDFVVGVKNIFAKQNEWIIENWESIWQSIQNNHTLCVFNQATDKLSCKTTKLSNPKNQELAHELEHEYKNAILSKDSFELARLLGLTYEGSTDVQRTYDLRQIEITDTIKRFVEGKYKLISVSLGWDIDINEKLVCTPTIVGQRLNSEYEIEEHLFVLPVVSIKAYGTGSIGSRNIEIYEKALINTTNEQLLMIKKLVNFQKPLLGIHVSVDDDKQTWIAHIYKEIKEMHNEVIFSRAKKHKVNPKKGLSWDILTRTDTLQQMIDCKYILFDEKNVNTLKELRISTLNKSGIKRDESSFRHKNYNYINSLEYAISPFAKRHLYFKVKRSAILDEWAL